MELVEIDEEPRLSREDAATWLHRLADSLERHNEVEFVHGGIRTRGEVPDEVGMEDEIEIEIEITW